MLNVKEQVNANLKAFRFERKLSQTDVGNDLYNGMAPYRRREVGEVEFTLSDLRGFRKKYDVSLEELARIFLL